MRPLHEIAPEHRLWLDPSHQTHAATPEHAHRCGSMREPHDPSCHLMPPALLEDATIVQPTGLPVE
jgi:hypothetical protein